MSSRPFTVGIIQDSASSDAQATLDQAVAHVREAAKRGAQIVFHPHAHLPEPGSYRPVTFADPANSFHEKAALCRAAENTCFFATVNYACDGSPTTSAVIGPDGTVICYQPYGKAGLLVAEVELSEATGLLASRCKTPA